jgi:hypothetical protein
MKKCLYFLLVSLLSAGSVFSQIPPPIDTFYHRLLLRDSDVQGVKVDTTYLTSLDVVIKNVYCQGFSIGTARGCILNLKLFNSNKKAADTAAFLRGDVACMFYPGLWGEFKGESIGDSCWYGNCPAPSLLVLRENLMLQISVIHSTDTLNRAVIIDIAKKIMEKYTANAVCTDPDTVSERCASSMLPSEVLVWNYTGDTLQIDSIKVEWDTIKYPQCALFFSKDVSAPIDFAFEHDTVKELIDCYPSSVECRIFDYNRITPGPGVQKMKIEPFFWQGPFSPFVIDTKFDTPPTHAIINYCSDSLATIQARIVFYVGKYRASLLVNGWVNSASTGVGFHGKSLCSPAKTRYSSRQLYDVLGRKIPSSLIVNRNKPDLKKQVYLRSKPK